MPRTYADFSTVATLSGTDHLVGYRAAATSGEFRATASQIATYVDGALSQVGTGAFVKAYNPPLEGYILNAARTITSTTLMGTEVDVYKPESSKAVSGNTSLTFSATPSAGHEFTLTLNASADSVVTIPSSYSVNRGGNITTVFVPADGTSRLLFRYTGARWEVFGDPAANELRTYIVGFTSNGGGTAIVPGKVGGFATAKANGVISSYTMTVDVGTPIVETWKIASGVSKPTVANSINPTGLSVVSGNSSIYSTDLSRFSTTTVSKGDIFAFNISSNTGSATEMSFGLEIVIS